jgi:RND family efflux transporter MFP subunit
MNLRLLFLLCAVLLGVVASAIPSQAGPYKVEVTTDPAIPVLGKATLTITITSAGEPVTDANVRAITQMPGMVMGEREESATPIAGKPGAYTAPAVFAMEGKYEVRVTINGSQGRAVAVVPLQTGQNTVSTGIDYPRIAIWALVIGVAVIVVLRMRTTGQKLAVKGIFSASVLWSLLFLGLAFAGAIYAINNFRRPGSMTPLEAQGMEMNTPAPEGITPVTLATAEREPFAASVRYTGQAVGNVEQDVIPRVSGILIWMPFYVGDKVTKGQVIAKLDTSQLDPDLAARQAGADSASNAMEVARSDYKQAQAGVSEAQAELAQFQGALDESKANLESSKEERKAADAELTSVQADLETALAGVTSADADQAYYAKQAARADSLFAAGAISQEQAQRKRADSQKADAAAMQARQMVRSAEAKIVSAQANIRKSNAQIVAAEKRIVQAQSELMSHHAHVRTAQAAASSSAAKISQAQSEERQSSAMLSGATAAKGYALIKAETDGVITDRLISAGTLVSIGQPIVRIAQIAPIRLQANVAESDLTKVRVGAAVRVWHRGTTERPLLARVTSVSPSVDPAARTGTVEAIIQNTDRRFLPGEFLSMEISLGEDREHVTIPTAAVHITVTSGGDEPAHFVWVASGTGKEMAAHKRLITLGERSGDRVAVMSGLKPGDQVVIQGATELGEGNSIAAQAPDAFSRSSVVSG